ncbi:MAG: hypothetical protein ABI629_09800 [bacterium]
MDTGAQWRISPYPDGHPFAFTIVHDADSAYSRRLAPLFAAFDELHFKITATAFMFWADWARHGAIWSEWMSTDSAEARWRAPMAVPMEVPQEAEFYLDLAARGHELGLHTPSETSSPRVDVVRAFEAFQRLFGALPRIYVEHAAKHNKDAQDSEGSRLGSPYYNTDLLNDSGAWIWVDHWTSLTERQPRFYDVLDGTGSPFNTAVAEAFGIRNGFVRSGRPRQADGDGFLTWYSREHTLDLARRCGTAIVYTHLDSAWIDPQTRQLRASIRERLAFIASLNPWLVPAGCILDRFRLFTTLSLRESEDALVVTNSGDAPVPGVTLIAPAAELGLRHGARSLLPGPDRRLVIGDIPARSEMRFQAQRSAGRTARDA